VSDDYQAYLAQHRRLSILIALQMQKEGLNDSILHDLVKRQAGVPSDRDNIRNALRWLETEGFVVIKEYSGLLVSKITKRGRQVANGEIEVDGVQTPSNPKLG